MNQIEITDHLPNWMFSQNMTLAQFNQYQRVFDAQNNVNQPNNTIGTVGGYTSGTQISTSGNTQGLVTFGPERNPAESAVLPYGTGMRGYAAPQLAAFLTRTNNTPLMSEQPGQNPNLVQAERNNEISNMFRVVAETEGNQQISVRNFDDTPGGVGITELETEYPNGRLPVATDFTNAGLRAAENFAGGISEATQSSMALGAISGGLNMVGNIAVGAMNFKAQEDAIAQRQQQFETMAPSLQALNAAEANEYNGKANLFNAQATNISQSYSYNDSLISRYQSSLAQSGLPGYLAFSGGAFAPRTAATQITGSGNSISSSLPGDPTSQSASGAGITYGQGDFVSPS